MRPGLTKMILIYYFWLLNYNSNMRQLLILYMDFTIIGIF